MSEKTLAERAAEIAAKKHKLKKPTVIEAAEALHPETGQPIHRFRIVGAADPTGTTVTVFLNEAGSMIEATPALEAIFDRPAPAGEAAGGAVAAITINPSTNVLTLNLGDTLDESITVTIPKGQKFRNVNLAPSASIALFVTSIDPPGGYGPITGEQEVTLTFRVRFHGIPCQDEQQVVTGTLDVVADQKVVAQKKVQITVPACPSQRVYSVKFVCGEQPECGCDCASVLPGRYATEINIHNYGLKEIVVQKRFIPVVLAGAPVGREPRVSGVRAEDKIVLPPQTATMDDCCRIAERLFGGVASSPLPLTIGFLQITSNGPLAITAVYTTRGLNGGGVSIEVEQIAARRL